MRERVRKQVQALAEAHGVTSEHITKAHIRKEEVVAKVLAARGEHPGVVHGISAMEACQSYEPWHDKNTRKSFLRPDTGKCLHYYFILDGRQTGAHLSAGSHPLSLSGSSSTETAIPAYPDLTTNPTVLSLSKGR